MNASLAACVFVGPVVQSLYHWRVETETATGLPVAMEIRGKPHARLEQETCVCQPFDASEVGILLPRGRPSAFPRPVADTAAAER